MLHDIKAKHGYNEVRIELRRRKDDFKSEEKGAL